MYHAGCQKIDTRCEGRRINPNGDGAKNWKECGRLCSDNPECKFWHFYISGKSCLMYKENECEFKIDAGNVAGARDCPGSDSKFKVDYDHTHGGNLHYS